jgi:hypothetical protein
VEREADKDNEALVEEDGTAVFPLLGASVGENEVESDRDGCVLLEMESDAEVLAEVDAAREDDADVLSDALAEVDGTAVRATLGGSVGENDVESERDGTPDDEGETLAELDAPAEAEADALADADGTAVLPVLGASVGEKDVDSDRDESAELERDALREPDDGVEALAEPLDDVDAERL